MNLFLGKSSEKHLKCEKYDKRKARAFAWDFVYSLREAASAASLFDVKPYKLNASGCPKTPEGHALSIPAEAPVK